MAEEFEGKKVNFICASCSAVNTRDGKAHFRKLGRKSKKTGGNTDEEAKKENHEKKEKQKPQAADSEEGFFGCGL